jgi:hypothetical protein
LSGWTFWERIRALTSDSVPESALVTRCNIMPDSGREDNLVPVYGAPFASVCDDQRRPQ